MAVIGKEELLRTESDALQKELHVVGVGQAVRASVHQEHGHGGNSPQIVFGRRQRVVPEEIVPPSVVILGERVRSILCASKKAQISSAYLSTSDPKTFD